MKKRKVIELTIDDLLFGENGVKAISLVEYPAIEENFMKFAGDKYNLTLAKADIEKRVITGPALIPEKEIYRFNKETNEEFYVFFSTETVEKISQRYLLEHRQDSVTVEHEFSIPGVILVETWLVKNPENDKAKELGWSVPAGTWMISMKIVDENIWNDLIKTGIVKGFSIEGFFIGQFSKESEPEKVDYERLLKETILSDLTDEEKITKIETIIKESDKKVE